MRYKGYFLTGGGGEKALPSPGALGMVVVGGFSDPLSRLEELC